MDSSYSVTVTNVMSTELDLFQDLSVLLQQRWKQDQVLPDLRARCHSLRTSYEGSVDRRAQRMSPRMLGWYLIFIGIEIIRWKPLF